MNYFVERAWSIAKENYGYRKPEYVNEFNHPSMAKSGISMEGGKHRYQETC